MPQPTLSFEEEMAKERGLQFAGPDVDEDEESTDTLLNKSGLSSLRHNDYQPGKRSAFLDNIGLGAYFEHNTPNSRLVLPILVSFFTGMLCQWLFLSEGDDPFTKELFETPFCESDSCKEESWVASPRTPYSARSVVGLSEWFRFHERWVPTTSFLQ